MIGIITYDAPHKKTQDLVYQLILKGHKDLHIVATPWVERKNFVPIYRHRPGKAIDTSLDQLCDQLSIGLSRQPMESLPDFLNQKKFDHILIAGAGILPESLAQAFKIINTHPGYLPYVKGLDAFKWAILQGHPIGVTTHYISEKADEGLLIQKKTVPVYFEDTFHSVAYRQYEMEIEMLADAVKIVEGHPTLEDLADDQYAANRRMPHHLEIKMMMKFEQLRAKAPSFRES
jgi:phosphoribosylglycinamide formyltransferase-1